MNTIAFIFTLYCTNLGSGGMQYEITPDSIIVRPADTMECQTDFFEGCRILITLDSKGVHMTQCPIPPPGM